MTSTFHTPDPDDFYVMVMEPGEPKWRVDAWGTYNACVMRMKNLMQLDRLNRVCVMHVVVATRPGDPVPKTLMEVELLKARK